MLPASTQLLGAVIRAFEAPKDASNPEVRCVLQHPTTRRGFAGLHHIRRWCCPLTAFCRFLVEDDLVKLPAAVEELGHFALFTPLAIEMCHWDVMRAQTRLPARAHLRAFLVRLAPRLSMFAASAGWRLDGRNMAGTPAWADRSRRVEPLGELKTRCGLPTNHAVAKISGCDEHDVGRWFSKGERPSRQSIDCLSKAFARRDATIDPEALGRELRWHYSLAALAERIANVDGVVAHECANIFSSSVACGVQRLLVSERADIERAVIAAFPAFPPKMENVVQHAERHGAPPDWRTDVYAVLDEEQRIAGRVPDNPSEALEWLAMRLPRRRPRASRKQGTRSKLRRGIRKT
jgi:hypothetical protein